MENAVLKKKLSTFRSEKGSLINVAPDVLQEVLRSWESWPGSTKEFYSSIGVSQRQMAVLMGKAKKMHREGSFPTEEFKEIKIESSAGFSGAPCGIELCWEAGKVIRFREVEQLVDFLKKVA
jgi:hypothetical protein